MARWLGNAVSASSSVNRRTVSMLRASKRVKAVSRVRGNEGAAGQRGAGQTGQHPELIHDAREGAVRRPTNQPTMRPSRSCSDCTSRSAVAGGSVAKRRSLRPPRRSMRRSLPSPEAVAFAEYRMNLVEGEP